MAKKPLTIVPRFTVTKNGVELPFIDIEIKKGEATKIVEDEDGIKRTLKWKGTKYPSFDKNWLLENPEKLIEFLGNKEVIGIIVSKMKQWSQNLWAQALIDNLSPDGSGDFDEAAATKDFIAAMETFSTRDNTIPEIKRQQAAIVDMLINDTDEEGNEVTRTAAEVEELKNEARRLKKLIESRKRTPSTPAVATPVPA